MIRRLMVLVVVMMALVVGRSGFGGGGLGGGAGGFGGGGGGGGGFGGAGGMNIDPDVAAQLIQNIQSDPEMMTSIQGMMQIGGQVIMNIQNSGGDAQAIMQDLGQQIQDGTMDFDTLQKQMVDKGYMTQDMVTQIQGIMVNLQGSVQKLLVNTTYDRIKQLLNPTEEEWAILLPKVKRVLDAQAEVAQGGETVNKENGVLGIGSMGGGMGRGMNFVSQVSGPQGSDTELGKAWKALQAALENKQLSDRQLQIRVRTWRDLHEKARAELEEAQKALLDMMTLRQEAVMMIVGVL